MRFSQVVFVCVIAGCSSAPPTTCSAANCSGCCDTATNTCLPGNSTSSCGALGYSCQFCAPNSLCLGGVCTPGQVVGGGTGGSGGGNVDGGLGGGNSGGGSGGGNVGGGSGGGNSGGGSGGGNIGGGSGGGTAAITIAEAKKLTFPAFIEFQNVVVTAISNVSPSVLGTQCPNANTNGKTASFWVADPSAPHSGIYVSKYRCDPPADYAPQIGDVLDIKGYIGFSASFIDREAYRVTVKSQFYFLPNPPSNCVPTESPSCQPLEIVVRGSQAPLSPSLVPSTFGNDGGLLAEPLYSGSRVLIQSPIGGLPLKISNPNPIAFKRQSLNTNDTLHYGFQLSNGVLVNNYKTFARFLSDGGAVPGTSTCDFRAFVLDGGTVEFPNGISGVWDSYSHAPCLDGSTDSDCYTTAGFVPGSEGATSTNVLYPTSCNDLTR